MQEVVGVMSNETQHIDSNYIVTELRLVQASTKRGNTEELEDVVKPSSISALQRHLLAITLIAGTVIETFEDIQRCNPSTQQYRSKPVPCNNFEQFECLVV